MCGSPSRVIPGLASPSPVASIRPMTVETLVFRPATPEDAGALGRLHHQLIRDEGHRNPMGEAELVARMRAWLADDGYEALVGFDEGEPVAYVLWRDEPEGVYLRQIFVQRDY